jgi:hypothetical protein
LEEEEEEVLGGERSLLRVEICIGTVVAAIVVILNEGVRGDEEGVVVSCNAVHA